MWSRRCGRIGNDKSARLRPFRTDSKLTENALTVEAEPKDPEVIWEAWGAPADICHATHRNRSTALNLTPIAGRSPPAAHPPEP